MREAFGAVGVPLTLSTMLVAYVAVIPLAATLTAYQNVLLMRYRLELVGRPALLVLDEASKSLDAGNETAILDAPAMFHGRMTIVVINHQHSALRDSDQAITAAYGQVVPNRRHDLLAERAA